VRRPQASRRAVFDPDGPGYGKSSRFTTVDFPRPTSLHREHPDSSWRRRNSCPDGRHSISPKSSPPMKISFALAPKSSSVGVCACSFLSAHPRSVPQDKLFSEALTRSLRNGKMAFLSPDAGLRSPRTLRAARTLNARPRASRSRNVPSKNSRLLDKTRLIRNDRDPERERAATLSKIPLLRNVSSLTLRPASVLAYALESNVRSCRLLR